MKVVQQVKKKKKVKMTKILEEMQLIEKKGNEKREKKNRKPAVTSVTETAVIRLNSDTGAKVKKKKEKGQTPVEECTSSNKKTNKKENKKFEENGRMAVQEPVRTEEPESTAMEEEWGKKQKRMIMSTSEAVCTDMENRSKKLKTEEDVLAGTDAEAEINEVQKMKKGKKKKRLKTVEKSVHLGAICEMETPAVEDDAGGTGSKKKSKKVSMGVGGTTDKGKTEELGDLGERKKKKKTKNKIIPGAESSTKAGESAKKKPVQVGPDSGNKHSYTNDTVEEKSHGEKNVKKKRFLSIAERKGMDDDEGGRSSSIQEGGTSAVGSGDTVESQEKPRGKSKMKKRKARGSNKSDTLNIGVERADEEERNNYSTTEEQRKRKKKRTLTEEQVATFDEVLQEEEPEPKKKKQAALAIGEDLSGCPEMAVPIEKTKKEKKKQKKNMDVKNCTLTKKEETKMSGPLKNNERTKNWEKETALKVKKEVTPAKETGQEVDVVFLSEKVGNKDEVNIDQERRKALQKEIDDASCPTFSPNLGQWGTAHFDSDSQQQKFLRLMGGLKSGNKSAASSKGWANMALGKQGQDCLQNGLLVEFERAKSRQMDFQNRGAGLGFSASSNKKFYIDVNACKSVRLDD